MSLKVPCGVSGRVRIVKENSLTGEITHDSEFENIWTDYGLSTISTYCSVFAPWPSILHWGSGSRDLPHSAVTSLANPIGSGGVNFSGTSGEGVTYDSSTCVVTRTRSAVQAARGVEWILSEMGLNNTSMNSEMRTYTLVKNLAGVPTPLTVSAIEIVTIYYTVQIQYPMTLPPQTVVVSGLPPTTASFKLHPERTNFAYTGLGGCAAVNLTAALASYTTATFTGAINNSSASNGKNIWNISLANRSNEFFGGSQSAAHHIWQLDPPITKNNTQILELEIFWQFANATPVEVP